MDMVVVNYKNKHYLIRENDKPIVVALVNNQAHIPIPGTYCFSTETVRKTVFGFTTNRKHVSDSMCFARPGIYKIGLENNEKIVDVTPLTCF